jgi:hypothetical protein
MFKWYTISFFFLLFQRGTNLRIGDSGIFDPCSIFFGIVIVELQICDFFFRI